MEKNSFGNEILKSGFTLIAQRIRLNENLSIPRAPTTSGAEVTQRIKPAYEDSYGPIYTVSNAASLILLNSQFEKRCANLVNHNDIVNFESR